MAGEMRKGAAGIAEAQERRGGGDFRPFVPQIQWREEDEEKFIRFLTPLDEIPTFEYFDWIPVGKGEKADGSTYTKYEHFISRKDPYIGEDYDDLQDRLGVDPKFRCLGIAVELEPVMETVKGRPRPVGFEVKTTTFTRKDEDGNEEEVTAPAIGIIVQAATNFWGWLSSYDSSMGPIEDVAFQVKRRGKKTDTAYDFIAIEGKPIDMSPLVENLEGISYLRSTLEADDGELLTALEQAADEDTAAFIIAEALFARRVEELSDAERYEELVGPIEEIEQKFGPKKKGGDDKKSTVKRERPKRERKAAAEDSDAEAPAEEAPAAEPTKAEKFAALRAKMDAKG